jgi:hypothetical protein
MVRVIVPDLDEVVNPVTWLKHRYAIRIRHRASLTDGAGAIFSSIFLLIVLLIFLLENRAAKSKDVSPALCQDVP